MALKTRAEYLASLKRMRPNIFKFGEAIADVTTHPATRRVVESHARAYDAANDSATAPLFATVSSLTEEKIHRHNSLMLSAEDVISNSKFKREMYRLTGTCTGGLCAGWNGMNTMWAVTHEVDKASGTDYHERLKRYVLKAQAEGWAIAGALTDAKGNRSLKASQQPDPDSNVHVTEVNEKGIVLRGAKLMICGTAASNEIFLMPGTGYGEAEKDFAVSCAVPRDIEGLTIIETRRPSDSREMEEGFDIPTETGITQAYLLFEDVFVPQRKGFPLQGIRIFRKSHSIFYIPLSGLHRGLRGRTGGCHDRRRDAHGPGQRPFGKEFCQQVRGNGGEQRNHFYHGNWSHCPRRQTCLRDLDPRFPEFPR